MSRTSTQITLEVDRQTVEVEQGALLLEAAAAIGVTVPTMCHLEGYPGFASCMVCVVRDVTTGNLVPACATRAADGMRIETGGEVVSNARRAALELLLSDHVGDCEGPCIHVCPAHMDIPKMIRQIEEGDFHQALITVKQQIPLPAVLGRICPAPCEKGCHRRRVDEPLAICQLKRFVADTDLESGDPYLPECTPATGKRVAIVGSGPTGLTAAYYLLQQGHACTIFDDNPEPGGMLRYGVSEEALPRAVLDAEIEVICRLGAELRMSTKIGKDVLFEQLREEYDAVVLALGANQSELVERFGIEVSKGRANVVTGSFATGLPGVFAGGGVIRPARMAVKAVADGWAIAISVGQYLTGEEVTGPLQHFQSWIGKLLPEEHEPVRRWSDSLRQDPSEARVEIDPSNPVPTEQAVAESTRCLRCTCLAVDSCELRRLAEEYNADGKRFRKRRRPIERFTRHDRLVHEPGKCIVCGRCVRITEKHGEELGLTFVGRGFDVRIEVPLGKSLSEGLNHTTGECAAACPTGALAREADGEEKQS
jgi:ferredoxin